MQDTSQEIEKEGVLAIDCSIGSSFIIYSIYETQEPLWKISSFGNKENPPMDNGWKCCSEIIQSKDREQRVALASTIFIYDS